MAGAKSRRKRVAPAALVAPSRVTAPSTDWLLDEAVGALDRMRAAQETDDYGRATDAALEAGTFWRLHQQAQVARGVAMGLLPRPANPELSGGRKRGAVDALGRVLLEILRPDPYKAAKDVLVALRSLVGTHPTLVRVGRAPHRGRRREVVVWRHPTTGTKRTTSWASIQAGRLPALSKLLKAPKRSRGSRD
jgi:hypothetical protein